MPPPRTLLYTRDKRKSKVEQAKAAWKSIEKIETETPRLIHKHDFSNKMLQHLSKVLESNSTFMANSKTIERTVDSAGYVDNNFDRYPHLVQLHTAVGKQRAKRESVNLVNVETNYQSARRLSCDLENVGAAQDAEPEHEALGMPSPTDNRMSSLYLVNVEN